MSANKVIKYLLKSSPVGEVHDVIQDLSTLVGMDTLKSPEIQQALKEYFETHLQQVQVGEERCLVTPSNSQPSEDNVFRYYDQAKNIIFSYDPYTLEGTL